MDEYGRAYKGGRYLEMVGSKVRIKNASGRTFTVPLTGFSPPIKNM